MRNKTFNVFVLLLCLAMLLVSGCATRPVTTPAIGALHPVAWPERRAELLAITHWTAQGVLSVNYGGKNTIASFDWQYAAPNYAVNIHSPMNLVNAHIINDRTGITLLTSTGRKAHAGSPEILMEQQLGWSLPLENLVYWIRALPAPEAAKTGSAGTWQLDSAAHVISLRQQSWNITYGDFAPAPNTNIDLPTTIYLYAAGVKIKIKITRWEL